jgi:type I restriction enzyme, S subunit
MMSANMQGEKLLGSLPDEWEYVTLGEACERGGGDIQTGPFGSQLHAADYVPFGIPSIMPQNIGDNRVIEDGISRITEADAERLSRYRVQFGDIVYSRRGDVERRALIRDHESGWLCGTGCLRVRLGYGEKAVDPSFTAYYLGHPNVREWIVRHAHGATMPNLNTSILSALPFVIAPKTEQRAIAAILGALDDKIELNRRMNHTLEELVRALFKEWFVDGAEEGWEEKPLDEIATYRNGLALQKFPAQDGEESLPVIKIAQLRTMDIESADRASAELDPAYIVNDGDILFSWSGSLEVVIWTGGTGALNQHLFKVTSEIYPKWLIYMWTLWHLPEFRHIAAGKATTMGHIQRHHLHAAMTLVPPETRMTEMSKVMGPLIERLTLGAIQSRTLAALRDTLLPKLIGGEIRAENVNYEQ